MGGWRVEEVAHREFEIHIILQIVPPDAPGLPYQQTPTDNGPIVSDWCDKKSLTVKSVD
ncbi:MAG: hypothetical protein AAGI49_10465 [Bacteroidota bacterium]